MATFDIGAHRLCFAFPRLVTEIGSWHGHIPFAFLCAELLRPRVFVELGAFRGDSYCAFNQAFEELDIPGTSYAVDTWSGDAHTGGYNDEVYDTLKKHHDPLYAKRSRLLRMTFDEALAKFNDNTVDLLHIDGLHTYAAVRHDFDTWLPKMSDRGVVLFHDVNVREGDFGVWRLWEELSKRYPHFAFTHSNGLGVLAVGKNVPKEFLDFLAQANDPQQQVQEIFYALGQRISTVARLERADAELAIYRRDIPLARERIAEQDARIAGLYGDLSAAGERENTARQSIETLHGMIAGREKDIADHQKYIGELTQDMDRLGAQMRGLEREIADLRHHNTNLDSERYRLAGIIDATYRSTSWRITKPIRFGSRLAVKLINVLLGRSHQREVHAAPTAAALAPNPDEDHSPDLSDAQLRPLISLIMPVYEIDPAFVTKAVESVQAQTYENWELCICDDGSKRSDTQDSLARLAAAEPRIKLARLEPNGGISAASNKALSLAKGEFVAFLDHDDALAPHALAHYVRRLNDKPDTDVFYGDEDKTDTEDRRFEPFYKPDWSPILFCGVMYVGHLLMVRRSLVEEIGGFDGTYNGVQDFELMLRLSEKTTRIEHVRRITYHWRNIPGSLAGSVSAKPEIGLKQAKAVNAHFERTNVKATAHPHPSLAHRLQIVPATPADAPKVSIIIPTKNAPELIGRCLDTIFGKTTYPNFEVIVVDNGTTDPQAKACLAKHPVKIVPFNERFNYSKANNLGAAAATGEYLLLLNNDTEVTDPTWLGALVAFMQLPKVGAVGPMLLYPNRSVQHAGVALGLRGTADHVMRGSPPDADGYAGSLACTREVVAVTAACLMVRRQLYLDLGGLREQYGTHYQDVDFCLRVRAAGFSLLYTPATSLIHHESATRGTDYDHLDRALFKDAWDHIILSGDPYHNPAVPAYA